MSGPAGRSSRIRLAATALALALFAMVVTAAPASAHATLVSTTPQQSSQVSAAPGSVSLTFSEGVGLSAGSIEVLDPAHQRIDRGVPHHPAGQSTTVTVDLKPGLLQASYVVVWHVVSSDSHPIEGTFSFGYGVAAGAAPAAVAGDPVVGGLDGLLRGIAYGGAVLLLGGTVFLVWLWPGGMTSPRPRRLVMVGWLASVVGAVGLFLLQGPYGAGQGLGGAVDPALITDTLDTQYGKVMLLRVVVLAFAAPILRLPPALSGADLRASRWNVAAFGPLFVITFSLAEHAGQGDLVPFWAGLDAFHLAAASIWVGGLAMMTYALLGRSTTADLAAVLPRWSRLAMVTVAILVVTGSAQAWHQIGSFSALAGTKYGLLVLGKVDLLIILLALGELSRRWVNRNTRRAASPVAELVAAGPVSADSPASMGMNPTGGVAVKGTGVQPLAPSVRRLRASVTAEVAIAAVVLGLTAVLVNTIPGGVAYDPSYSATVVGQGNNGQDITVRFDLDRTKVGPTTVRIYTYTKAGAVPFVAVGGSLTERSKGLGPVKFTFTAAGPGRGTAATVVVPTAGTWTLTAQIRTDETTDYAATTVYPVR